MSQIFETIFNGLYGRPPTADEIASHKEGVAAQEERDAPHVRTMQTVSDFISEQMGKPRISSADEHWWWSADYESSDSGAISTGYCVNLTQDIGVPHLTVMMSDGLQPDAKLLAALGFAVWHGLAIDAFSSDNNPMFITLPPRS